MPNFRNLKQKQKSLDSSCCFFYCDLQFEFYLGFVFLIFGISGLPRWILIYPTGLVRVRF